MRKIKLFLTLLMLMCIGVTQMWAEEKVSTLTFTAAAGGSGTADDAVDWTVTSDGTESTYDATKGIHYGTGSAQVTYIQLATSGISGTITKVVVNASTASGVTASASVTVGGSAFGGEPKSLSATATNYTFDGSASGEIVVRVAKPSKATKAIYVKSVAVTYTTGGDDPTPPTPTLSSIEVATAPTTLTYTEGDVFDPTGLVITRTFSSGDPDTYVYAGHTEEFSFEPSLSTALTTSDASVTITYGGKSTTQNITVNAASSGDEPGGGDESNDGLINFGSADGSTNISGTSVTGDDSRGQTWTITTAGTTSFTPSAEYAQIGSSKKPATSITFTTTLNQAMTVSAFSAKFGGFSGTAGTVTLKVDDTTVGSGSLDGTTDVTINASNTTTSGTVLTVTVTGIDKGVKAYYISYTVASTGGDEPVSPKPVITFSPQEGSFCEAQNVTLSSSVEGATIYYSIDDADPSTLYTGVIAVSETTTIKAYATKDNTDGDVASATFTITAKEDPTITPTDGNVEVGKTLDVSTLFSSNSVGAITYSITAGDAATIEGNTLSAVKAGSVTVQASQEANGCYNAKTATATVTVTAPLPKITITADQIANFTNSYAEYDWTAGGVSGKTYAYKNAGIQLNSDKAGHYVYNTTPVPGNITKITMTKASGSDRSWTPYVSDETMTAPVEGKNLSTQTVGTSGTNWEVTGSNQYFYLNVAGGSTVISSIVITYEPIISAVTVDDKIAHGSVAVSGAEDLTAVAAGTELTLTNTPSDEYQLKEYNVYKTGDAETKISVTNGKFIMPLYDVTVSAEFEESKELDHLVITSEASQKTFWVNEPFNSTGLAIKAVYDNDTEKENVTPKSISTPDMSEAGVKTVTIAYQEKEIEKTTSYEITVKALPNDPTKPCTVVEALDYLDKFDDLEDAYVTGKVSEITEEFSSYGNISYNISDDGETTSPQLLVFRGKDFGGVNFPNAEAILVGDSVVVTGKIFTYEKTNTKEFAQNNQIVYRPKKVVSIALSEGYKTAFNDNEEFSHEGVTVTATYNYGDDEPVSATWSEPVMTQLGEQEVTVSYTYEGKTVEFKYTITITHVCAPENLVAVTKGEEDNTKGTYTVVEENVCTEGDGATVDVTDIVPAEGYRFKEITATAGDVDNNLKKVTGIKAATTITVVFEEIPTRTINYSIGGAVSSTTAKEGTSILAALPENPTPCDATNYPTFYGWKAGAAIEGLSDDAPEILNNEALVTASTPDVTYYAVFTNASSTDLFTWNGGVKADLTTLVNVTAKGLGSDYAEGNAPYRVKFDTDKDEIVIAVSSAISSTTFGVKMVGGSDATSIKVQEADAADAETFTDVESFEISGSQGSTHEFITSTAFKAESRAVKLLFVKGSGSNVGVGPIHIEGVAVAAKYMTTCCTKRAITIDANIANGTVVADLELACENDEVTLSPTAVGPYHFDAWDVYVTNSDPKEVVTVTNNKFIMPAAAVTVSATFEHDPCQGLEKPALDGEIVVDYQSAIIAWNEVENASSYVLNITEGETPIVENASITDLTDLSYLVENLTANATYNYSIMAVGDGIDYCATNTALEGNFTTVELPAAHLILSENGEEFEFEENQHKLNDVVTLPSELHYSGCTGKVLKGWSKAAVAEQDEEPTENYYAAGTQYTIGATADKLYAVFATEGAGQASTLFSETFDNCTSTGGNDNAWSNSIANGTLSLEGWTVVSGNAASGCAKFGASKAAGSAETPAIEITGAATLTFRAGAWSGDNTTLKISASGATLDQSSVTIASAAWNSYTVAISEATGSVKIKFESNVTNKGRFFLDDVVVSQSAISYSAYTTSCAAALDVPTFSLNPVVTPVEDEYQEAIHVVIATEVEDAIIYYTTNGNNPTTASAVYSEPITLNTCGEHTIKAFVKKDAQESAIATATYTLAIPVPASDVTPFTPQQAIDVYNSGCYNNEQVHVKGVVTGASYNETLQNNAAAYNGSYNVFVKEIGDNSENPVTYEFYRMWKDNNNTAFTKGDIKAGDTITATGTMTKYQTTYEFNAGCYMESYVAYNEPKTDISNTIDDPYTVEVADGLIENIQSDLTKTVFVKGIITAFPSSTKVTIRDTENGEEYIQLFQYTLADGINDLAIGDQIIATGTMQKYNNLTYQMNAGCQVVWKKAKVVIEIANMQMVVNDVATITPTNVTPEAAAEAITYSIKEGSDECITLNNAEITATAVGTATIIATVETAETYIGTSVEFTVTVAAQADTRKTAQDLDGFAVISGDLNNEISFEAKKGNASTDPITYGNPAFIRIYQGGGYLAIDAAKGCTIDEVIITIPEGCNNTTIGVGTDEDNLPETGSAATAGNTFSTGTGMNSQHVYLVCLGTSKTTRLEIGTIVVKYTGEAQAVDHYSVIADNVVTTEFPKNGTFSSEGLVVYACYDANCEDYVDITDQCNVVADLTSIGEKKAEVYLGEEKLGEYDITVVAGQEDPALAYTPASETIPAAGIGGWVAPTLNNPFNVTPSYNTNNAAVATVDESGVIALAGGYGKAVITASFAETEDYIASVATYTITVQEPANKIAGEWHKVTSTADITVGSKVIIANIAEGTDVKTMGAVSDNGKYRLEVASTVDNEGILSAEDGTKTFTLVDAGNGLYAFQGNNGKYLSAASSSSNDMKEVTMIDANASWSISIEEGVATILAQGSYTRNWLRYNQTNTRFSCYASGQQDIALYVNRKEYVAPAVDPENPTPATPVAINTNVEEEEIVASGNVVVTVNTDNFEEPKSYIAQNGATIVINGNGAEEAKSVIADEQSTIQVNQLTTVNQVFSVAATMGAGLSGQITGVDNVTIAESTEAYFDITLGDNANPDKWHAIAVPFPVDAISGIYDAETGAKLNNEEHYAIMDYHGDIRAQGLYGWKKFRGIMSPGVFYLMTVDGNTKTFRFKMSGVTLPTATSLALQLFAASGDGQSTDAGWNGVANPTLQHGTVNQTVTVLNPNTYTYEDKDAGEMNFVVGTPYFIQANATIVAQGMEMGAVDDTKPYYAPKRVSENGFENIKVFFGNEEYKDKLTISANVEALNEYQIGKDLVKMTMTNTPSVAQIFGNAYNAKLCRVYAPMANDQAEYSLTLYAPNAGEYTISAPEMEDADIFLTYEGSIIWNLSMSDYTNDFAKGNNEGYGLILVKKAPQVITGVDNAEANEAGVQKVIINDHVYILRAEQMYDVTGKMVK